MSGHYREECSHGLVRSQCRCMSPDKEIRRVDCTDVPRHDEALAERGVPVPLQAPAARCVVEVQLLLSEEVRVVVDGQRIGEYGFVGLDVAGRQLLQALLDRIEAPTDPTGLVYKLAARHV